MTAYLKLIIFGLVCVAIPSLVFFAGGEYASMARHFIRNLFRYLF